MGRLSASRVALKFDLTLGPILVLALAVCPWRLVQAQFGMPSQDGKLDISAYWFKADGKEPRPVVLALHGCGGALDAKGQLNPIWRRYAAYFNAERIHFVALDSFSPRGVKSICETAQKRRTVREEDRREDVFAAITWLAQQPSVDASRMLVAGWSHGAQTVLSVMDASDAYVQLQKARPRAAVAFYPGCTRSLQKGAYALESPLLVMVGELDDWTPASPCAALRDKVLRDHKDAAFDLVVYPGSYHGFDGLGPVHTRDNVGNTRSGKATVGGNPSAQKASHARLFEFVSVQLGEPLLLTHEQRLKLRPSALLP